MEKEEDTVVEEVVEDTTNKEEVVVENIPKPRFDEVINERNYFKERSSRAEVIEEENTRLREELLKFVQSQQTVANAPKEDLLELRKSMADALVEGRTDDAIRYQEQLEVIRDNQNKVLFEARLKELESEVTNKVTTQYEEKAFDKELKKTLKEHPEFDPNSSSYNSSLTNKVADRMETYHMSGKYSKRDALAQALEDTLEPKRSLDFKDKTKEQREANVSDITNIPPKMTTESNKSHLATDVDVSKMTDAEFRKLMKDPEEFKRLAGYKTA